MFTVTGKDKVVRRNRTVTWDNGELSGEGDFPAWVESRAVVLEGTPVGPVGGPYTLTRHLESDLSSLFLIMDMLDPKTIKADGDVPTAPALPPGAIG